MTKAEQKERLELRLAYWRKLARVHSGNGRPVPAQICRDAAHAIEQQLKALGLGVKP